MEVDVGMTSDEFERAVAEFIEVYRCDKQEPKKAKAVNAYALFLRQFSKDYAALRRFKSTETDALIKAHRARAAIELLDLRINKQHWILATAHAAAWKSMCHTRKCQWHNIAQLVNASRGRTVQHMPVWTTPMV